MTRRAGAKGRPVGRRPQEIVISELPLIAQDPDEPFDVVTADGAPTGRRKPRALVHRDGDWHRAVHVWDRDGDWHRAVHVWVAGSDDRGEAHLTFQRRSPRKDTWPNRYDATVGGHYRAGETLTETLREVEEEIGIPVDASMLRPLGTRVSANEREAGVVDREIQDVLLLRDDRPLSEFAPNPAELAALARFPLAALIPFLAGDTDAVAGLAFLPGAATAHATIATVDEFIPSIDRYFLRVAIAVRDALRGEPYVTV